MINELFDLINEHKIAACVAAVIFFMAGAGAIYLYHITSPGPTLPETTPTAPASGTPLPTATPAPTAAPTTAVPTATPTATPVPSPTVTPDMVIARSISPLDQYAPNHMVQVDRSTNMGLLSVDLYNSDTGGQYAYRNDTYTACLTLADISNMSIDRIRIHTLCINGTGNDNILYEDDRIDYVLLRPGDKIRRTIGFKVPSDATQGVYKLRIVITADLQKNNTWPDFGCSYESGLNILIAP